MNEKDSMTSNNHERIVELYERVPDHKKESFILFIQHLVKVLNEEEENISKKGENENG